MNNKIPNNSIDDYSEGFQHYGRRSKGVSIGFPEETKVQSQRGQQLKEHSKFGAPIKTSFSRHLKHEQNISKDSLQANSVSVPILPQMPTSMQTSLDMSQTHFKKRANPMNLMPQIGSQNQNSLTSLQINQDLSPKQPQKQRHNIINTKFQLHKSRIKVQAEQNSGHSTNTQSIPHIIPSSRISVQQIAQNNHNNAMSNMSVEDNYTNDLVIMNSSPIHNQLSFRGKRVPQKIQTKNIYQQRSAKPTQQLPQSQVQLPFSNYNDHYSNLAQNHGQQTSTSFNKARLQQSNAENDVYVTDQASSLLSYRVKDIESENLYTKKNVPTVGVSSGKNYYKSKIRAKNQKTFHSQTAQTQQQSVAHDSSKEFSESGLQSQQSNDYEEGDYIDASSQVKLRNSSNLSLNRVNSNKSSTKHLMDSNAQADKIRSNFIQQFQKPTSVVASVTSSNRPYIPDIVILDQKEQKIQQVSKMKSKGLTSVESALLPKLNQDSGINILKKSIDNFKYAKQSGIRNENNTISIIEENQSSIEDTYTQLTQSDQYPHQTYEPSIKTVESEHVYTQGSSQQQQKTTSIQQSNMLPLHSTSSNHLRYKFNSKKFRYQSSTDQTPQKYRGTDKPSKKKTEHLDQYEPPKNVSSTISIQQQNIKVGIAPMMTNKGTRNQKPSQQQKLITASNMNAFAHPAKNKSINSLGPPSQTPHQAFSCQTSISNLTTVLKQQEELKESSRTRFGKKTGMSSENHSSDPVEKYDFARSITNKEKTFLSAGPNNNRMLQLPAQHASYSVAIKDDRKFKIIKNSNPTLKTIDEALDSKNNTQSLAVKSQLKKTVDEREINRSSMTKRSTENARGFESSSQQNILSNQTINSKKQSHKSTLQILSNNFRGQKYRQISSSTKNHQMLNSLSTHNGRQQHQTKIQLVPQNLSMIQLGSANKGRQQQVKQAFNSPQKKKIAEQIGRAGSGTSMSSAISAYSIKVNQNPNQTNPNSQNCSFREDPKQRSQAASQQSNGLHQINEMPSSKNTARREDEDSKEYDIIEDDQVHDIIDNASNAQKIPNPPYAAHEIQILENNVRKEQSYDLDFEEYRDIVPCTPGPTTQNPTKEAESSNEADESYDVQDFIQDDHEFGEIHETSQMIANQSLQQRGSMFIPTSNSNVPKRPDSSKQIRIRINKNKKILEHLTKFSQDIDEIRDKEGMSLLFYDFNGFKSSMSHRSIVSSTQNQSNCHMNSYRNANFDPNQINKSIGQHENPPHLTSARVRYDHSNKDKVSHPKFSYNTTEQDSENPTTNMFQTDDPTRYKKSSRNGKPSKFMTINEKKFNNQRPPDSQEMLRRIDKKKPSQKSIYEDDQSIQPPSAKRKLSPCFGVPRINNKSSNLDKQGMHSGVRLQSEISAYPLIASDQKVLKQNASGFNNLSEFIQKTTSQYDHQHSRDCSPSKKIPTQGHRASFNTQGGHTDIPLKNETNMTQLSFDRYDTSLREQEEGMNTYDSASKSIENQDAMMYQSFNNHAPTNKKTTIDPSDIRIQESPKITQIRQSQQSNLQNSQRVSQQNKPQQNDSQRNLATSQQQEQIIEIRNQSSRGDQIQSLSVVKLNIKRDSMQTSDYMEEPISRIEVVIENKQTTDDNMLDDMDSSNKIEISGSFGGSKTLKQQISVKSISRKIQKQDNSTRNGEQLLQNVDSSISKGNHTGTMNGHASDWVQTPEIGRRGARRTQPLSETESYSNINEQSRQTSSKGAVPVPQIAIRSAEKAL